MPVILSARIPVHLLFTKEVKRKRRISGDNYLRLQTFGAGTTLLENFHPLGDQWLLRHTPESWKFVVTAVMETMRRRSENSGFGLASSDEEQRQACVAYYRHLFNKINSLQANKVLALELRAAPLATNPNVMQATDAFARSLKEIASWDWPCKLVLEHCDAMTSSSPKRLFAFRKCAGSYYRL